MIRISLAVVVILAVAVTANAVVIESFESGSGDIFGTGILGTSTTGATDGVLAGYGDPVGWWAPTFQTGYDTTVSDYLATGWILSVDVTLPETPGEGQYFQVWFQIMGGGVGDSADFGYSTITGGGVTDTVVVDYSGFGIDFASASWGHIRMGTNPGGGFDATVLYFDNMQVTPEPATMVLLGLGGIGMLLRRRRA